MDRLVDPRLLPDAPDVNDQAVASPYTYPPASAASAAPAPYTLNPTLQHEESPQPQANAQSSLQNAPPGHPYYNVHQEARPQIQSPSLQLQLHSATSFSPGAGDQDIPKRPRACEACRGLKVRCDFEGDLSEICKRCSKANRECVVTAPNRRRPKKTDTRVADLEKRIDDLTASLEEQKRQSAGGKRLASESGFEDNVFYNGGVPEFHAEPVRKKQKSNYGAEDNSNGFMQHGLPLAFPLDNSLRGNEYADAIDRGILTAEDAVKIFDHYTNNMAKHLPAVVFPATATAGSLRKSKPVLFAAILSIASGQDFPDIQRTLNREVTKTLADRVLCRSEKSIELIQAMQVLSIWHSTEDHDDTMAFQLIQMASSMAIAMELGGPPLRGALGMSFINPTSKAPEDFNSAEKRRAWLSCYTLAGR